VKRINIVTPARPPPEPRIPSLALIQTNIKELAFLKLDRLPRISIHIRKWTKTNRVRNRHQSRSDRKLSAVEVKQRACPASSIPNPEQTPIIPVTLRQQICQNEDGERQRRMTNAKNTIFARSDTKTHDSASSSSDRRPTPCKPKPCSANGLFSIPDLISFVEFLLFPFAQTPSNVNKKNAEWYLVCKTLLPGVEKPSAACGPDACLEKKKKKKKVKVLEGCLDMTLQTPLPQFHNRVVSPL